MMCYYGIMNRRKSNQKEKRSFRETTAKKRRIDGQNVYQEIRLKRTEIGFNTSFRQRHHQPPQ